MRFSQIEFGLYISDSGRLWSNRNGELVRLKTDYGRTDYERVRITIKGRKQTIPIHRLVAEHFVPNPENKPCVNHIDGNPSNNRHTNLEWVTHKENCRKGRNTKLTKEIVSMIKGAPNTYGTGAALGRMFDVSLVTVSAIRTGRLWEEVEPKEPTEEFLNLLRMYKFR